MPILRKPYTDTGEFNPPPSMPPPPAPSYVPPPTGGSKPGKPDYGSTETPREIPLPIPAPGQATGAPMVSPGASTPTPIPPPAFGGTLSVPPLPTEPTIPAVAPPQVTQRPAPPSLTSPDGGGDPFSPSPATRRAAPPSPAVERSAYAALLSPAQNTPLFGRLGGLEGGGLGVPGLGNDAGPQSDEELLQTLLSYLVTG